MIEKVVLRFFQNCRLRIDCQMLYTIWTTWFCSSNQLLKIEIRILTKYIDTWQTEEKVIGRKWLCQRWGILFVFSFFACVCAVYLFCIVRVCIWTGLTCNYPRIAAQRWMLRVDALPCGSTAPVKRRRDQMVRA